MSVKKYSIFEICNYIEKFIHINIVTNESWIRLIKKWNARGFRPPLSTYRLNWTKRTSWGWWDEWDDTKFVPWQTEAEHTTSRSRSLSTILHFWSGKETFCLLKTWRSEWGSNPQYQNFPAGSFNHCTRATRKIVPKSNVITSTLMVFYIIICSRNIGYFNYENTYKYLKRPRFLNADIIWPIKNCWCNSQLVQWCLKKQLS